MNEKTVIILALLSVIPTVALLIGLWSIPGIQQWAFQQGPVRMLILKYLVYCSVAVLVIVLADTISEIKTRTEVKK